MQRCGESQVVSFSSTALAQAPRLEFHFFWQESNPKLEEAASCVFDLVTLPLEESLCHLRQADSRSPLSRHWRCFEKTWVPDCYSQSESSIHSLLGWAKSRCFHRLSTPPARFRLVVSMSVHYLSAAQG